MANIDAGVFFLLLGLAFLGFVLIKRLTDYLILSGVLFMALAIMLFAGYDVTVTKHIENQTTYLSQYNANGSLLTNTTQFTPAYAENTSIIGSLQMVFGWVFFGFSMITLLLWIREVFT